MLAHALGWRLTEFAQLARNGVESTWLDETDKSALRGRVETRLLAARTEETA